MLFIKKIILFAFLLFLSNFAFSQEYLNKITQQTCVCFSQVLDTLSHPDLKIELSNCMASAADVYNSEIKQNKLDLDTLSIVTNEMVGIIMKKILSYCPETLLKAKGYTNISPKNIPLLTLTGVIIKIETIGLITFYIKDENDKISSFTWLESIECDKDLPNIYPTLTNKKVVLSYKKNIYFVPQLNQNKEFSCVKKIEFIE